MLVVGAQIYIPPLQRAGSVIARWGLPQNSLATDFIRLLYKGEIAHQTDDRFFEQGLLLSGHGICNSVCAAAVAITQASYYPLSGGVLAHADLVPSTVATLTHLTGKDARMGSSVFSGVEYLEGLVALGDLPDSLLFKRFYGASLEAHILFEPGQIVYQGVRLIDHKGESIGSHAVLLIAMNSAEKKVLVFDPNNNRELQTYSYHEKDDPYGVYLNEPGSRFDWARMEEHVLVDRGDLKSLTPEMHERLRR